MADALFWQTLWLTFQLATVTSIILLVLATPLAWKISRHQGPARPFIEAIIALPLVLPPSVLGFYLLVAFAPDSSVGSLWQSLFNQRLAFSFEGLVIASVLYSAPFVFQPLINHFQQFPESLLHAASTLGCSPKQRFTHVVLPMVKSTLISATVMGFAHTVGEFGVVLMIGGNIPGETQVMSIALFQQVELLNYEAANQYAFVLLLFSAIMLVTVFSLKGRRNYGA
jgi:molybdate transport system permease protein